MMALNKSWRVRWQQRRGTQELQATPLEFWTFSCVCFRSPEGRRENSPGLQPWERHKQGNRPERASESGLAGNVEICCYEISMPQLLSHIIFGINARQSAALSGRFCFGTPSAGLKPRAILFFALRADAKRPNCMARSFQGPEAWELQAVPSPEVVSQLLNMP